MKIINTSNVSQVNVMFEELSVGETYVYNHSATDRDLCVKTGDDKYIIYYQNNGYWVTGHQGTMSMRVTRIPSELTVSF